MCPLLCQIIVNQIPSLTLFKFFTKFLRSFHNYLLTTTTFEVVVARSKALEQCPHWILYMFKQKLNMPTLNPPPAFSSQCEIALMIVVNRATRMTILSKEVRETQFKTLARSFLSKEAVDMHLDFLSNNYYKARVKGCGDIWNFRLGHLELQPIYARGLHQLITRGMNVTDKTSK